MLRRFFALGCTTLLACPGPTADPDGGAAGGVAGGSATGGGMAVLVDAGPGLLARPANPTCVAPARPSTTSMVQITRAFTNLTFAAPMLMLQAPGTPDRVYIMERAGRVRAFPNRETAMQAEVTTVIDITGPVDDQGEGGLLGMAFHPEWPTRKELFLSYTRAGNPLISVISRFRTTDDGVTFNPASEERLLELDQPYSNHNGGGIAFGRDGFLYIGLGDGGSGGDPLNAGQRTDTNLGKFLRIDVNVPAAQRYAIPPTNPYANGTVCNNGRRDTAVDAGAGQTRCAEIYALGLRNPWRWSFDQATGELWAGDVGQGTFEEVDLITNGANYGWRPCEGFFRTGSTSNRCATPGFTDPVVAYGRNTGVSITGGYVYRGSTIPSLVGRFIFGDFGSGRVMAVTDDPSGNRTIEELADTNFQISSFGQTLDGEVYVLDLSGGRIHQIRPMTGMMQGTFPARLSQTGCFDSADVKRPGAMLIPYDLNSPFWSDGAEKERFFAIPDGTTIRIGADGDFEFPNGTVTVKTFRLSGKRIETRLFVRHSDGQWAGYTYEWRDDESDADLVPNGKTKLIGTQSWLYPSGAQCLTCHTAAAGRSLGPEVAQLNRDLIYPRGVIANQLETLETIGMLAAPLGMPVSALPKLEPPNGSGSAEARARGYLHSNCSNCHRQGGGPGMQDFRYSLTVAQMNVCGVRPQLGDLGVMDPLLLAPMAPSRSIIPLRMKSTMFRMPPVGSSVVHAEGAALIDAWIQGLTACP